MRKFNRKKYIIYGDKWYGEVKDLYKVTHSLNKNFTCSGFVLSSQDEDYHQEKVNRMGRRCFCTLY